MRLLLATWWILLFFIPFVNIIIGFLVVYDFVRAFGKEMGFAIGTIFLPFIFYPLLAFGGSRYVGKVAAQAPPQAPQNPNMPPSSPQANQVPPTQAPPQSPPPASPPSNQEPPQSQPPAV